MTLQVKTGDLFNSSSQTLVNTVNTVGVMGKGIALEFKKRFPDMYDDYVNRCKAGRVKLGEPYLYRTLIQPWILNFPTKEHWRSVATLSAIRNGLEFLLDNYRKWGITSLAVPPLGCGLGGLDWGIVGPCLGEYLSKLDIPVELFAPHGTPLGQLTIGFVLNQDAPSTDLEARKANRIPDGWLAIIEILARINREQYHWPIGRVAFEKIAYFATMAGIKTRLQFSQGSFGPHSDEYAGMRAVLVNNGLLAEIRQGRTFVQQFGETYSLSSEMHDKIFEWNDEIERITDLFSRIETTAQAELAASVHFAVNILNAETHEQPTEIEVFEYVRDWKKRRRPAPFPDAVIAEAVRDMAILGWLNVKGSSDLPLEPDWNVRFAS